MFGSFDSIERDRKRSLIVKIVKGTAFFLVLCLAAYGAFVLLKKPPQLDVCVNDYAYLEEELGIVLQSGQAADSGLSGLLGDVEGLPSFGSTTGSPFGGGGSSAPPSFLTGSASSFTPPSFMEDAPRVAAGHLEPQQSIQQPMPTMEILPPPGYSDPVNFPAPPPFEPLPFEVPSLEPPVSFDAPAFEVLMSPSETPPIAIAESPPPWTEGWNGPASDIPTTPPPAEFLQPLPSPFNPIVHTSAETLLPHGQIASQPVDKNIPSRTEEGFRRIGSDSVPVSLMATSKDMVTSKDYEHVFSSSESISLDIALSSARYTQTSSRQPPTFEPARPETSPTAPVVAFAPPRRTEQIQLHPQPERIQQAAAAPPQRPVVPNPIMTPTMAPAVAPIITHSEVKQIGTPRLIESVPPPVAQSPAAQQPVIRETIDRFIQSQRRLAESGDPDSVRQAFIHLSQIYELDQLEEAERALMHPILDSLALRVIYARETHILEPPYRVKPGETIESIAGDFNLPPALLRKINSLGTSQELPVGATVKVVNGQFDARISIQRKELTLLLGGLYAGRFSFSLPNDPMSIRKGEFYVTHRTDRMLTLNNGWILATNHVREATIVLTDQDAREIFDILSEHSVIVVE